MSQGNRFFSLVSNQKRVSHNSSFFQFFVAMVRKFMCRNIYIHVCVRGTVGIANNLETFLKNLKLPSTLKIKYVKKRV